MAERTQSFKNHARWFPLHHFFVMPVLAINVANAARHLIIEPTRSRGWGFITTLALLMLGLSARIMALAVQDRVIRLEMRLRLREVLPPDLQPRVGELTRQQLVALRFASDAELPELTRDVLDGRVASP